MTTKVLIVLPLAASLAVGPAILAEPSVRVDGARVIATDGHYSFVLPTGWRLDERSKPEAVSVSHVETGSSCSVLTKPSAQDVDAEFKGLKLAVPFVGGKWSKVGEQWVRLGGRRAGELVSTRAYPQEDPLRLWDVVAVRKGVAYIVECSVPIAHLDARESDVRTVFESFRWE